MYTTRAKTSGAYLNKYNIIQVFFVVVVILNFIFPTGIGPSLEEYLAILVFKVTSTLEREFWFSSVLTIISLDKV